MSNPKIIIEPDGFIIDDLKISYELITHLKNLREPDTIRARNILSLNSLRIAGNDTDGVVEREFYWLLNYFHEILQNLDGETIYENKEPWNSQ